MDFTQINAGALAYLGDSVLEALIRERLILKGYEKSSKLNKEALNYVTAVNQAKAYENIESSLTEIEAQIFRRGKNSSHLNASKSASLLEYKIATGFEAIFGYLRLTKNEERISELFNLAYPQI
ncbi:MAG: Mini-ribonuclease 3 [Clostridia bacterium]|nr:Mini-ribonuclease 3 [Clostridia bacterium]